MKITVPKFAVPFCAFEEPMGGKALKLLLYLIASSRFRGECQPGYAAMRKAMRDSDGDIGSNATVRAALCELKKRGWIFKMTRTAGVMRIYMQIPLRFRRMEGAETKLRLFNYKKTGCSMTELPVVQ